MSRYEQFDVAAINLRPIAERGHDLLASQCLPLEPSAVPFEHPQFAELVEHVAEARRRDRPVVLMMGAHPIKLGLSRYLVDLIERRLITHLATNGAGIIHDFELATVGGTSESVAHWITQGQFGLWRETSRLNDIVAEAARRGEGAGEAVGREIEQQEAPHRELSIAAAGWRCRVPVTSHVGIGCDIVHAHPNCDGAAWGTTSYTDFRIFARAIEQLEGGVLLNVGTAVMGPEVYLKALSMARNVARQEGRTLCDFTTAVFDLADLPDDYDRGTPPKQHPQYYYRPWKTILVRTVADGGRSYYFRGDHSDTLPTLWHALTQRRAPLESH